MNKAIKIILLCLLVASGCQVRAEEREFATPLTEAHIRFEKIGWQSYEFRVVHNLRDHQELEYEWTIDGREKYQEPELEYYFDKGEHTVEVRVRDEFGNVEKDRVVMKISFWSLNNNWLLWLVYGLVILLIIYYWIGRELIEKLKRRE